MNLTKFWVSCQHWLMYVDDGHVFFKQVIYFILFFLCSWIPWTIMADKGGKSCPICTEEMDLTDQQLKPCKCGYEVQSCLFTYIRIYRHEIPLLISMFLSLLFNALFFLSLFKFLCNPSAIWRKWKVGIKTQQYGISLKSIMSLYII